MPEITASATVQATEIRLVVDTSALSPEQYSALCTALDRAGVAVPTDQTAPVRWEIGSRSGSWFALRVRIGGDRLIEGDSNRPGVRCDYHREDCPIPTCRRDHREPA